MGGQISWLIPAALIALIVLLWVSRRAGRTDRTRAAALLWGGWLLVAGLVLSFMSGITHSYYTLAIAPPIGALTGIGAARLWPVRHTWLGRAALASALAATAAWAWVLLGRSPGWHPGLRVIIAAAAVLAAVAILARPAARARPGLLAAVGVPLAMLAGLGGPLAYSLDTAASTYSGSGPSAGPALTAGQGGAPGGAAAGRGQVGGPGGRPGGQHGGGAANPTLSSAFVRLLEAGAGGYTWAAATDGSDSAAAMELATGGVPVMAIGGFRGTDPAPSLAGFESLVARHEIHYYVAGGAGRGFGGNRAGRGGGGAGARGGRTGGGGAAGRGTAGGQGGAAGPGGQRGGGTDAAQISAWVEAHYTAATVGGMTVYNLSTPTAT